ncbi:MAG: glycosyltransferase family 2 protein [Anaerolineae bacterium]|nr:glycosyltransferase family 2 protein [Anaerolineae bacterium]
MNPLTKPKNTPTTEPGYDGFEPIRVVQVELSQPIPPILATDEKTGRQYQHARSLVRFHSQPIGFVDVDLREFGLSAEDYARQIWEQLGENINLYLHQNELPKVSSLSVKGIATGRKPKHIIERDKVLADPPMISVVIPTRDRTASLAVCLNTIMQLEYNNFEVIVVDNAPSTQDTQHMIREKYGHDPRVRYVLESRPGVSWARNRGVEEAAGGIIAFTDDDVQIDRHWLAEIAVEFMTGDNIACLTGLTPAAELDTPPQVWVERDLAGFGKGFTRLVYDKTEHKPRSLFYPYSAGIFGVSANMAIKKSVFTDLGGFDPALGPGTPAGAGDDLDLFFRIIAGGHRLVYQPNG